MGPGGTQVRNADYVVPDRRRFLYRVHHHRGSCRALWGGRLWILCHSLLHSAVSIHDAGAAQALGNLPPQRLRNAGRLRARPLRQPTALDCDRAYRHSGDYAVYRAATGRDARGDRGTGHQRRVAAGRRVPDSGGVHLYQRAAGAGGDCDRERRDAVHHGAGGDHCYPREAGRIRTHLQLPPGPRSSSIRRRGR